MKARIVQFTFGLGAFNEKDKLVRKKLFDKKPQMAAKEIIKLEAGIVGSKLASLIAILEKDGYDTFMFGNRDIANSVKKTLGVKTELIKPSEVDLFLNKAKNIAIETKFVKNAEDLLLWNHNISLELTKLKIKVAIEERDLIVSQAIQTLDDLDKIINLFMSRLREWYGIHFPELDRLIEKHETYARLVVNIGVRENFSVEALEKRDLPRDKASIVAEVAAKSMGADISNQDLKQVKALGKNVLSLYGLRRNLEKYIDKTMEEMAPNIKSIAGALLGARLIALAGSLKSLAMKPASTIQVLGAEKALFRSLKTGARPPKHGLIFQHALLHDAKRWQRGKIARVIAGKLAIAARIDAFGGKYVGDALKADIERRLAEIREKYKEPPPPKERKKKPERNKERERNRRPRQRGRNWRKKKRASKS